MSVRRFDLLSWTLAAGAVCGLSWLLLAPDPWWLIDLLLGRASGNSAATGQSDKFHHVLGYLALTLALQLCVVSRGRSAMLLASIVALGHGAAIEWLQQFVPPRTSDVADVLADAAGVVAGLSVALLFARQFDCLDRQPASSNAVLVEGGRQ